MPSSLSELEKTLHEARKQFLATAKTADSQIANEVTKFEKQLKSSNARTKKVKAQLQAAREQFARTNTIAAAKKLETAKAELIESRAQARVLRGEIGPLKEEKKATKKLAQKARSFDQAIEKAETAWNKKNGKPRKKRASKKKAATGTRTGARATAKKRTSKKRATRKKTAARRKSGNRATSGKRTGTTRKKTAVRKKTASRK